MTSKKYLEKLEEENQELKKLYACERQLNRNQYYIIKEFYEKNLKLEEENSKLKKVIEILKTQDVSISVLERSKNYIEYNNYIESYFDYNIWNMSQEDFDLLKEYIDDN